jgi:hypothetical protein
MKLKEEPQLLFLRRKGRETFSSAGLKNAKKYFRKTLPLWGNAAIIRRMLKRIFFEKAMLFRKYSLIAEL